MPTQSLRLLDVLRARRELRVLEVHALLNDLKGSGGSALISELQDRPLIDLLAVAPQAGGGASTLSNDVTTWPALDWFADGSSQGGDATDATIGLAGEMTIAPGRRTGWGPAGQLAELIHALLGGPVDVLGRPRFSPLPCLEERSNQALIEAATSRTNDNAWAFWSDFARTLPPEETLVPCGMVRWRLSTPGSRHTGPPSTRLDLLCSGQSTPPVRLVADDTFRIGRSRSMSDWPVHFWENGELSAARTKQFSRIHVIASAARGGFVDGDGRQPSANGGAYGGKALSTGYEVPIGTGGYLMLAREYELQVKPMRRSEVHWPWIIEGIPQDPAPDRAPNGRLAGAVFFIPAEDQPIVRDAIWMGGEIGFNPGPGGSLRWSIDPIATSAWFVHRAGSFWIANHHASRGVIAVNGQSLASGEIAPVGAGTSLSLAGREWDVRDTARDDQD